MNREKIPSMRKLATHPAADPQLLEPMLTIPQVAEILAVSHATVFRLVKYSGLPTTKMGHTTRIPKGKLHKWIEEHTA